MLLPGGSEKYEGTSNNEPDGDDLVYPEISAVFIVSDKIDTETKTAVKDQELSKC